MPSMSSTTAGSSRRAAPSWSSSSRRRATAGSRRRSRRPPPRTMEPTATTAPAHPRSLEEIRAEFPILAREIHGEPLAYLDNGATSQKPLAVIEALDRYWRHENSNVHRGVYRLSEEATELYEHARRAVAARLGADRREVVFIRNATEALNLVAYSWGRQSIAAGDRILL